MMRYLRRQRKSQISNIGFRYVCCFLIAILLLLSMAHSVATVDERVFVSYLEPVSYIARGNDMTGQTLSKPSLQDKEQRYAVRENYVLRGIVTLQQRGFFRFRNQQQIRLLVWYIMGGIFPLLLLFFSYYGDGKRQQQELIPRSLQIVLYRNRSDGKKEGIAFSIK